MATCPSGHQTNNTDFCDVCGLPISAGVPAPAPDAAAGAASISCPNCHAANVAEALFCESCGYDFTTGSMPPAAPAPAWPTLPATEPTQVEAPAEQPPAADASPSAATPDAVDAQDAVDTPPVTVLQPPPVDWIAELWIDPDWYASQGSTDPMPSPGLPDIVPLVKERNLVGRVSQSRGIFPEVDCELDSGVSRRHAMLTTDGNRWWIEDLNSANGTFVGAAAGPLPAMPIPQGRVELSPGQRIYVGAWTRIVIRPATDDERTAFTH